jgi:hypothetical protein
VTVFFSLNLKDLGKVKGFTLCELEHSVAEQFLVIPKTELRGSSSTGRNGGTSVCIVKEPALMGLTSHPCKYSILVARD